MRVLLFGTFDRLHPGHRFVLDQALRRGQVFVVVARDATVLRLKGRAPEESEDARRAAIERAYPGVSAVLGDPVDYLRPVRELRPDIILLGYDQRLPPGITINQLPCPVERLPAFEPETYKSSFRRTDR